MWLNQKSAALIDSIFLNYHDRQCISGNWTTFISDHLPQFIIVENLLEIIIDRNDDQIEHRDYKNFNTSSIVNGVIGTISSQFIYLFFFFLRKHFVRKKIPKRKRNNFNPLRSLLEVFVRAKKCCLCVFLFAKFCFVSWLLLVTCFCALKIFS